MPKKSKYVEFEVGRDAINGEFITVAEAKRRPKTTIVQKIKRPRKLKK